MARDDGEQQAMTSERLTEIRSLFDDPNNRFDAIIHELLAEVERRRAALVTAEEREAALVEVVRVVADGLLMEINNRQIGEVVGDGLLLPLRGSHIRELARALLASTCDERSGGDGA